MQTHPTYEELEKKIQALQEESLRESESRFRAIFEQAAVGVAQIETRSGRFLRINRRYCDILGYTPREMNERTFQEITHPGDLQEDLDNMKRLEAGTIREFTMEKRYFHKDGTLVWVKLAVSPMWQPGEEPDYHVAVVEEITEKKRIEAALRESERRMTTLLDNLPGMAYRCLNDRHWTMRVVSQGCLALTGYEPAALLDSRRVSYGEIIHPEDRETVWNQVQKAVKKEGPFQLTYRIITADGQERWVWEQGRAVLRKGENPEALEGFIIDITGRIKAEREREELEGHLRQTQKMEAIGTLAGGIAHDFNNILAVITGYTELLQFDTKMDDEAHARLAELLAAADRGRDLSRQILTFSRQTEQERKPLDVRLVIREVLKFLRASIPVTVELRQDFQETSAMILGDPTRIHQILMNLCTNAWQAMRDTGGVLEVGLSDFRLRSRDPVLHPDLKAGDYLALTVKDTGHGMPGSIMERIFEPFFTTKGPGEGTGMGLAVVHGIVRSHKGEITVSSEPGKGTLFTVLLPQLETSSAEARAPREPLERGDASILLVDDEAALAGLYRDMLERLGHRVTAETSPEAALNDFRANPWGFDLVLTDMTMPGMTGLDLARKILGIRPDTPILLCTGFSETLDPDEAASIGIREILMKPVPAGRLSRIIREICDRGER